MAAEASDIAHKEGLLSIFKSGEYSDFTIVCGHNTYNVHKAVICPRSEFFASACNGKFKEAEDSKIDLSHNDHLAVGAMVDYLYIFDYSVAPEDEIDPILLHARVYIIADEFNIPALKMLAKEKFEQLATFDWNNSSFSLAISEIYELPPDDRGLRDVVVTVARKHVKALRDRGEFNTVLRDKPDFTIDLLDLALKADEGDSRVDEQKVYEPKADGPEVDEDPWGFQGFSSKKKVKKGQFCSQCHDCGKYCLP